MCTPASFVLTRDRVCWSRVTNSHEDIIREYTLHVDGARGPNVVRVEITPGDGNYFSDPATWIFCTDQDQFPEWYDPARDEARTRAALPEWHQYHCCSQDAEGPNASLLGGDMVTQTAGNDSTLKAGYRSTLTAGKRSTLTAGDDSTLKAGNDSTLKAGNRSTLKAGDGSTLTAGYQTIQISHWYDNGWRVATRVVTEAEADKWWHVSKGAWRECTPDEIATAESKITG